jgi:hypothetical protein
MPAAEVARKQQFSMMKKKRVATTEGVALAGLAYEQPRSALRP